MRHCSYRRPSYVLLPFILLAIFTDSEFVHGLGTISADINVWNLALAGAEGDFGNPAGQQIVQEVAESRFWDRADLDQGVAVSNYVQMRPFLNRLDSGQPVSVLAFGTSITKNFGGCYPICASGKAVKTSGWLRSFMQTLNATWPHSGHRLYNNGQSGRSFTNLAQGVCLDFSMPARIDLLVLEHIPYLEPSSIGFPPISGISAEMIVHRVQMHFNFSRPPPIIFINMLPIAGFGDPHFDVMDQCIQSRGAKCDQLCPESFEGLPLAGTEHDSAEISVDHVAAHHGFTSFSYARLVRAVREHKARAGGNMSDCQLFSDLYADRMHPSLAGELLLADLMVGYLANSQGHLASSGATVHTRLGRPQPTQPLFQASLKLPLMRCYDAVADGVESGMVAPGAAMEVLVSEGWELVEVESGKRRPGWVATQPGSVLRVSLNTSLGVAMRRELVTIVVTFLSSYEHMGQARVSCVSGCSCDGIVIDGHITDFKHSVPKLIGMIVKRPRQCVLEVRVLPETRSGQHKVKISQLAVKIFVDVSSNLRYGMDMDLEADNLTSVSFHGQH